MARRPSRSSASTRRFLLQSGLAAAAAALAGSAPGAAAEGDDAGGVFRYDAIEPEKYPWGWIRWLLNAKIDPKAEMTLGLVHMEPGQTNTRHVHPNSAEILHVISGSLEHLVGDRWVPLKTGDTLRIPKGVAHQGRTRGEGFLALIAYDTPNRVMVPVPQP